MKTLQILGLASVTIVVLGVSAAAQTGMTFSIDFQGPTAVAPGPFTGRPDFFANMPIDEGSILTPGLPGPAGPNPPAFGPLPAPGVMVTAVNSGFGSVPGGLGIRPGAQGGVELDALSYGRDALGTVPNGMPADVYFSVDEFAMGFPGTSVWPDVFTEGSMRAREASADTFMYVGPPGPVGPGAPFGNTAFTDGDGLASTSGAVYPGVGLREPNPPSPGSWHDQGDNLDAMDLDTTFGDIQQGPIYFSLDSHFADPLEVWPPVNSGTAIGNGFVGGDVLVSTPGGMPALFIPAFALGLDRFGGPDSDDLDALALDLSLQPAPGSILFSVRRGSAVIGAPDSLWGAPIEEGDVLTMPVPGGVSPFPAIWLPGEALGLMTARMGGGSYGADDLDALDVVPEPATMMLLGMGSLTLLRRRRS